MNNLNPNSAALRALFIPPQVGWQPGARVSNNKRAATRHAASAFAMGTHFQTLLQAAIVLLLLQLCWQHSWSDASASIPTNARDGQRQLVPVDSIAKHTTPVPCSATVPPALALYAQPAPAPPVPFWEANVAEDRLKHFWRRPEGPGGKPGSRGAAVEIHNDSWAFLDKRQLSRGSSSVGDPLRMQCLAARLLAGEATKLSTVGGSVSFGTTFTTSRSKSLFHWKMYQWINATFSGARHEHYCGAVAASGPSYMEHCLHWHVIDEADLVRRPRP